MVWRKKLIQDWPLADCLFIACTTAILYQLKHTFLLAMRKSNKWTATTLGKSSLIDIWMTSDADESKLLYHIASVYMFVHADPLKCSMNNDQSAFVYFVIRRLWWGF